MSDLARKHQEDNVRGEAVVLCDVSPFLPGPVNVVISQDLDRYPRLPKENILRQIPIVPQVNSAEEHRERDSNDTY